MLVLFLAFLLLVVAPGVLLFLGSAIQRVVDPRHYRPSAEPGAASTAEDAWFRRSMRPAFYQDKENVADAQPHP